MLKELHDFEFDLDLIALDHPDGLLTYADLIARANVLKEDPAWSFNSIDFIKGNRSIDEYVRLFACLFLGRPYCPLNPKFGSEREAAIRGRAGLMTGSEVIRELAYIIFTSGTTGIPKGVPISRVQLSNRLLTFLQILNPIVGDRIMQLADFSFDLSIVEMAVAWSSGSTLYSISSDKVLLAARYAKEHEITMWFSVPSVISMSHKLGLLKPGSLPNIRVAFFGGEALTFDAARIFHLAAPNAKIFNFYGPTEATISVAHYEVNPNLLSPQTNLARLPNVIPIGLPHSDVKMKIIDPLTMQLTNLTGELCISTDQLTQGYLGAPDLNQTQFFLEDGNRWYKTGDLVSWDDDFGYLYLGRADRQIKLKGYRIELQDIESALRTATKTDLVCVVSYPVLDDGAIQDLVGVVVKSPFEEFDPNEIKKSLETILPSYMVPSKILLIDEMPLSVNGKIDFKAVQNWVSQRLS